MSGLKAELHNSLQATRQSLLSRLEGLREYDLRRLWCRRPGLPGDESDPNAGMWATPEESSESVISLYHRACEHADLTIAGLDLDAPGSVAHWDEGDRATTLGAILIWMVWETAQHAGHADIIRELIDGTAGADHDQILTEPGARRCDSPKRGWRHEQALVGLVQSEFSGA